MHWNQKRINPGQRITRRLAKVLDSLNMVKISRDEEPRILKTRKSSQASQCECLSSSRYCSDTTISNNEDVKPPTKSIGEAIRQPYTAEPKKSIKISSAHQHVHPAKGFMAPAEGVKFSNDPIPFGKPAQSQGKRSGPAQPQPAKETPYPPSESIILPEIDSEYPLVFSCLIADTLILMTIRQRNNQSLNQRGQNHLFSLRN